MLASYRSHLLWSVNLSPPILFFKDLISARCEGIGSSPARCQASTLDKRKEREIVSARRRHLLHPPPCRASLH
ncbi:hypothetical protein Taro_018666 [Colocasia esculenta]|uniref:Uncharacterized protein n=1 Tax=Colocasia esculenta TaxID=4460 RepID=A0A843V350_COLES|nr:hypothetical protein [Colocasia esculenta]